MIRSILISVLTLLSTFNLGLAQGYCSIKTENGFPSKGQPLYLSKDGKFYQPTKNLRNEVVLQVPNGETLTLYCTGRNNKLELTGGASAVAQCVGGDVFRLDGSRGNQPITNLTCSEVSMADVQTTPRRCAGSGTVVEVGFKLGNSFLKQLESCFDPIESKVFYVKETLGRFVNKGAAINSNRPGFKEGLDSLFPGVNTDRLYKKKSQTEAFENVLGLRGYLNNTSFISRGHVAPHGDYIFAARQFATYFFVNVAPQWYSTNRYNWLTIEFTARKLAEKLESDLEVVSGTHGVLKLADEQGRMKEVYLLPSGGRPRFPVPEVFWKSVFDPKRRLGIVFVVGNNPFYKMAPLCRDVCQETGWTFKHKENPYRGEIVCCRHDDLRSQIPYVPKYNLADILRKP